MRGWGEGDGGEVGGSGGVWKEGQVVVVEGCGGWGVGQKEPSEETEKEGGGNCIKRHREVIPKMKRGFG